MNSVVITGYEMITPLGATAESTWAGLKEARSGIARIRRFDPSGFAVRFAAETQEPAIDMSVELSEFGRSLLSDLKGKLAYAAAKKALEMAGIQEGGPRLGVCLGSEAARPHLSEIHQRIAQGSLPSPLELRCLGPNAPTELVAEMIAAEGPCSTVSTACTSSSQAVGEGMLRIRRGEADVMVVGGVDVLVDPIMVTGFSLLGALSTRNDAPEAASRPFDVDRDGFVLGEGAGFLILESERHAKARGADILGKLSGFGCSCNAYRVTDSPPDGRGAVQSMRAALADAGLNPGDIGYINAHGTSTAMNDASETRGIHRAFGPGHAAMVSSTKSMMGHLVAACGAVEAIISLLAVRDGILPPTLNLDNIDPDCALNHIPHHAIERRISHAMTNAFGFGGSNGTLVVSEWR
jgi:3-oxoacyl-[acyl-carrier-protein] synthase II